MSEYVENCSDGNKKKRSLSWFFPNAVARTDRVKGSQNY